MALREFTEPTIQLIEKYTDVRVDPIWVDGLVAASTLIVFLLGANSVILWLRRRILKDRMALPEEQLAMVNLIAQDVNGIKQHLREVQDSLRESFSMQLDRAVDQIRISYNDNEPTALQPEPMANAAAATPTGKHLRKLVALRVRDAVMAKFVGGGWFDEHPKNRHTYVFERTALDRSLIEIDLGTPYRQGEQAGRYTLEVWVDERKVLNLEWRDGTEPTLKYLIAGEWVEVITGWRFSIPKHLRPLAQAAE